MSNDEQLIEEFKQEEQQQPEVMEQPQETQEEASQAKQEPVKESDADRNWKRMREEREADRRRAEEAERRANELHQLLLQQNSSQKQTPRDPDEEELSKLTQDDLITVKHHDRKVDRKLKPVEQEMKNLRAELAEIRFRTKYPDMDTVLSKENIDMLRTQKPELAKIIYNMKADESEKAIAAYEIIKGMIPTVSRDELIDKKKAVENSKKPISIQSIPRTSALGNAHTWERGAPSKELREATWKQMQEDMKRG